MAQRHSLCPQLAIDPGPGALAGKGAEVMRLYTLRNKSPKGTMRAAIFSATELHFGWVLAARAS